MVRVRPATEDERAAVANVLDGAALSFDTDRLAAAITDDEVLVAVPEADGDVDDSSVLGALLLDNEEITAVAVRRRRRDQGIGTALVEAAAERHERLVAEFDAGARPFWTALEFEIEPVDGADRFRGVR